MSALIRNVLFWGSKQSWIGGEFSSSIIPMDLLGKPLGIAKGDPFAGVLGIKPLLNGLHSECKGGKLLPVGPGSSSPLKKLSGKACSCLLEVIRCGASETMIKRMHLICMIMKKLAP